MIQRPKELEEDYGGEDVLAREECPDPYKMDPNTPWPTSPDEIEDLLEETAKSGSEEAEYIYELHITAELEAEGNELHIRADIGKHLEERGPGVYTVFASLLKDQVEGITFSRGRSSTRWTLRNTTQRDKQRVPQDEGPRPVQPESGESFDRLRMSGVRKDG